MAAARTVWMAGHPSCPERRRGVSAFAGALAIVVAIQWSRGSIQLPPSFAVIGAAPDGIGGNVAAAANAMAAAKPPPSDELARTSMQLGGQGHLSSDIVPMTEDRQVKSDKRVLRGPGMYQSPPCIRMPWGAPVGDGTGINKKDSCDAIYTGCMTVCQRYRGYRIVLWKIKYCQDMCYRKRRACYFQARSFEQKYHQNFEWKGASSPEKPYAGC